MGITYTPHPRLDRRIVAQIREPKVTGTVVVLVNEDNIWLTVPKAEDERGRTVYRDAGPGELQAGMAVVPDPIRINGVAYVGDTRMSHDARRGWYEDSLYGFHREGTFDDGMTAAARRAMLPILQRLATELATPERIKAARIESATYALERAREAFDTARTELEQAETHLAEVSR